MPLFTKFVSRQARKPSGLFGRFVATRIFDRGNDVINSVMLDVVAPKKGQAVLEIGFGCGNVIRAVADRIGDGHVEGIDFSDAMINVATKRNRHHLKEGRVSLKHGDFDKHGYAPSSFDTVCSANTIYFWPNPEATCARIHSVLKPGGKIVLAFMDKSKMDAMPLDMDVFRSISCDEVKGLLEGVGFTSVQHHAPDGEKSLYCVSGYK